MSDVVALFVVSPSICVALVVVATQIWGGQTPLKTKEIDPDIKEGCHSEVSARVSVVVKLGRHGPRAVHLTLYSIL